MAKNFSTQKIIGMISKCIEGTITSEVLGNWVMAAWYYYIEGTRRNVTLTKKKKVIETLYEIGSRWGIIVSNKGKEAELPLDFLKKKLKKLKGIK